MSRRVGPYAAAVLLAALVRLPGLGEPPLHPAEAGSAWTARALARGEVAPALEHPPTSALLLGSQVLLLWFLGGGEEGVVRLVPALVGTAAVLLPLLLRRRLGGAAALALSLLVAIEPSWVASSRTASGGVVSAAAALLVLALQTRQGHGEADQDNRLRLALAAAWGLLLASGPLAWDFLVPLLLTAAVFRPAHAAQAAQPHLPRAAVLGAAVVPALLVATSGLAQWRGPAAVSSGLTAWLASWPAPGIVAGQALQRSAVAVAPLLVLAVGGLVVAWRGTQLASPPWRRRWLVWLAGWLAWGCVVQLRAAPPVAAASLAVAFPAVLAMATGVGAACERLRAREEIGRLPRPVLASAAVVLLLLLLLGAATLRARGGAPAAPVAGIAELRADLGALVRPPSSSQAPRRVVAVVGEPFAHPVLGWYLGELEGARWVRAPADPGNLGDEQLILTSRDGEARLSGSTGLLLGVYRIAESQQGRRGE